MGDRMQIIYQSTKGPKTLQLTKTSTTQDLFDEIFKIEEVDIDDVDMYVVFGGKPIRHPNKNNGKAIPLREYGMQDGSTIHIMARLRGGINPAKALQVKKSTLTELPPHIKISYEKDMITLDDDPNVRRAKMPCGHVIGPASMTTYARSMLSEGAFQFTCPHMDDKMKRCGAVWDYFLVRHVAALSKEEEKEFETLLNNNLLKSPGIRQCPGCSIHCQRKEQHNPRVICGICTKRNNGTLFEFCLYCNGTWKTSNTKACGNDACEGKDGLLKILKDAEKVEIVGVKNCPSIRVCPNCDVLIKHAGGCKQMQCIWCKAYFCFICLKKKDGKGNWQCGSWNTKCTLAPIQEV